MQDLEIWFLERLTTTCTIYMMMPQSPVDPKMQQLFLVTLVSDYRTLTAKQVIQKRYHILSRV